jgi:beta-glucosidase
LNMNRIIKWSLITLGVLLVLLMFTLSILWYVNVTYPLQSVKLDKSEFPHLHSPADISDTAWSLISQMTFEEKVDQLYGETFVQVMPRFAFNFLIHKRFPHIFAGGNKRLNIPPWILSDGPRGARVLHPEVDGVTVFPVAMARGASWNPQLEYKINDAIAKEMIANGVNYAATPCINLLRHPGWGRAQETYGEDPWLLGQFGVAAVRGLEDNHIMACPKHFAANSIENSRYYINVKMDDRTLREVYLPHFKRTIQLGQPASIMSAYNMVNGDYAGENKVLLDQILRKEWGFEGFVTSDWFMGAYDGPKAAIAGLNVEMPAQQAYQYKVLSQAIEEGKLSETRIDTLVYQTLSTRLKYALAANDWTVDRSIIANQQHTQLALRAAEESMVLLKNNSVLPILPSKGKTLAVIGSLADIENTGDQGSSNAAPAYVLTPLKGLSRLYEPKGHTVLHHDGSDLDSVKLLAQIADEVILVVGYTYQEEGEFISIDQSEIEASAKAGRRTGNATTTGGDRESLRLSSADEKLIKIATDENNKVIVVYKGGSALHMEEWLPAVEGILYAWYGGMEEGTALANIISGSVAPSGKLPFSIASSEEDYPFFTPYTTEISYGYYHGYTLFDKQSIQPRFPFGYGQSYTDFAIDHDAIDKVTLVKSDSLKLEVQITNTGYVAGHEVVQLYIGFSNSAANRPVKLLKDFLKVYLQPKETRIIELSVAIEDLAWFDPKDQQWKIESMEYEYFIGNSSALSDLKAGRFNID